MSSTRLVAAASFGVPEFARVLESVVERYGSTPDSTTSSSRSTRTHVRPGSRLQAPNARCTKLFPTTFFTLRRRNGVARASRSGPRPGRDVADREPRPLTSWPVFTGPFACGADRAGALALPVCLVVAALVPALHRWDARRGVRVVAGGFYAMRSEFRDR